MAWSCDFVRHSQCGLTNLLPFPKEPSFVLSARRSLVSCYSSLSPPLPPSTFTSHPERRNLFPGFLIRSLAFCSLHLSCSWVPLSQQCALLTFLDSAATGDHAFTPHCVFTHVFVLKDVRVEVINEWVRCDVCLSVPGLPHSVWSFLVLSADPQSPDFMLLLQSFTQCTCTTLVWSTHQL